ncbi:MAG: hypothetical protein LUD50_03010 [Clostridia bacterium]|nr:hypothetical protein [Clostridia bacterium]
MRAMARAAEMQRLSGGTTDGHTCSECCNFLTITPTDRTVFKCKLYGVTRSQASDWAKSWRACAWFNQERPERNLMMVHAHEKKPVPQCEGQIVFTDIDPAAGWPEQEKEEDRRNEERESRKEMRT